MISRLDPSSQDHGPRGHEPGDIPWQTCTDAWRLHSCLPRRIDCFGDGCIIVMTSQACTLNISFVVHFQCTYKLPCFWKYSTLVERSIAGSVHYGNYGTLWQFQCNQTLHAHHRPPNLLSQTQNPSYIEAWWSVWQSVGQTSIHDGIAWLVDNIIRPDLDFCHSS